MILAETAFSTQDSVKERLETILAKLFLKLIPQDVFFNMSAKRYGYPNQDIGEFIKGEMSIYDHQTGIRVMSAAFSFSSKEQLQNIQAPTLVIIAQYNPQTHAQGKLLAELIPNARLEIIPQANHMANLDNPQMFNQSVFAFLNEST